MSHTLEKDFIILDLFCSVVVQKKQRKNWVELQRDSILLCDDLRFLVIYPKQRKIITNGYGENYLSDYSLRKFKFHSYIMSTSW